MSNVLEFRPALAGGPVTVGRPFQSRTPEAAAEIVIFPGVRYERVSEPCEPSPKPSRGGRGKSVRRGAK